MIAQQPRGLRAGLLPWLLYSLLGVLYLLGIPATGWEIDSDDMVASTLSAGLEEGTEVPDEHLLNAPSEHVRSLA